MSEPKYHRVLLKISGEALAGEAHRGLDFDVIGGVCDVVKKCVEKGRVVIFACGTGNPFFSTDTGAVLRAAEINADAILLAKNIDGVYSADPAKDPTAVRYDEISYDEVLAKHLAVMDSTATSLSMDNHIPVQVFALKDPENILRVVMGEKIGTIVKEEL